MNLQYLFAILVCVTAAASYINYRFVKLPKSIGLTLISLAISLAIMLLLSIGQLWVAPLQKYLGGINFSHTVMNGMLSYLLFAGALHINAVELSKHKKVIATLATASVLISCILIGYSTWYVANLFGIHYSLIYFLIFGALIAPTDPIGVLNAMKRCKVPGHAKMKITGEALFNDAVGILLFVILLQVLNGQVQKLNYFDVSLLLLRQGLGGILFGYIAGRFTSVLIKRANNEDVAILLTLALVTGGYALATILEISGPIAMVIAGLVVGEQCRKPFFSPKTVDRLDSFWGLIDNMLNSFLFVMIGLEILSIHAEWLAILVGLMAFVLIIVVRGISIILPLLVLEPIRRFSWRIISIMTWGGMRGGLSIALALTIPSSAGKSTIICITYAVVMASIMIQGLTLQPVITRLFPPDKS